MKKAVYKKDGSYPHGSLREQSEMKKPEERRMLYGVTKSLRTIPCSENNWKDGQELIQNVDYVVISNDPDSGNFLALPMDVAVPIVQETEDELWFGSR